jgi:hypothetical protein
MGWRYWSAGRRAVACLVFFGMGAVLGMLPGLRAEAVPGAQVPSPSPAAVVASRFQANAIALESPRTDSQPQGQGGGFTLASAVDVPLVLDPQLVYSAAPEGPAAAELPATTAALPAPDEPAAPPSPPKRAAQPAHPAPVSHNLLNNAQIASIRSRLKLSSYQDQLWPPVESALRDIDLGKDPKAKTAKAEARAAAIDPNSPPVQRLKSAAVPLIMSFNDDQKQEVRTLLRLMGLESLATQF